MGWQELLPAGGGSDDPGRLYPRGGRGEGARRAARRATRPLQPLQPLQPLHPARRGDAPVTAVTAVTAVTTVTAVTAVHPLDLASEVAVSATVRVLRADEHRRNLVVEGWPRLSSG